MTHFAGLGALLGSALAFPTLFVSGFWSGLFIFGLSAWAFTASGSFAMRFDPPGEVGPAPIPSLRLSAEAAADEALLATITLFPPTLRDRDLPRVAAELSAAREMFGSQGWLEKPAEYHVTPPPLESPTLRAARVRGINYEHLSFDSGYEPHVDEPGRDRWLSYEANRTAHAWVLRHPQPGRPWLVCLHGFQMGRAILDFSAFSTEWLHHRLGVNLIMPTLPLHGYRKAGRRSGDGYLTVDTLDSVHAVAQTMWDVRRLLGWVRAQGNSPIGVMGYSLGGYNTALLTTLEDQLACAIVGVPLTDISSVVLRHGPALKLLQAQQAGLSHARMSEVMRVVSPLALEPKLPIERRAIFAAVADRLVAPKSASEFWEHWGQPRMEWYQGGHITFRAHPHIRALIETSLRGAGLTL
jgi:pimeloyl-ACP methyl ester carboxylesterase